MKKEHVVGIYQRAHKREDIITYIISYSLSGL